MKRFIRIGDIGINLTQVTHWSIERPFGSQEAMIAHLEALHEEGDRPVPRDLPVDYFARVQLTLTSIGGGADGSYGEQVVVHRADAVALAAYLDAEAFDVEAWHTAEQERALRVRSRHGVPFGDDATREAAHQDVEDRADARHADLEEAVAEMMDPARPWEPRGLTQYCVVGVYSPGGARIVAGVLEGVGQFLDSETHSGGYERFATEVWAPDADAAALAINGTNVAGEAVPMQEKGAQA